MQCEITARLLISAIHFAQPTSFLSRNSWHLRLVSIEGSQSFLWCALSSDRLERGDQVLDLGDASGARCPVSTHAFDEVQPKLRVRARTIAACFFLAVGQNGVAHVAMWQPSRKFIEIRGERLHVMEVFARVLAQVFAAEFACRPCPVKRMAKQIVFCDA